jgi:anti-anti-sigma factor
MAGPPPSNEPALLGDRSDEFGTWTAMEDEWVILGLRGEIDLRNAAAFATVLDELIDAGHRLILLDLGELGFVDRSGVRMIDDAARRLCQAGGALRIRSASPIVARLLDITDSAMASMLI